MAFAPIKRIDVDGPTYHAPTVVGDPIYLSIPKAEYSEQALELDRIGDDAIRRDEAIRDGEGRVVPSRWIFQTVGDNREAADQLRILAQEADSLKGKISLRMQVNSHRINNVVLLPAGAILKAFGK